MPTHVNKVAVAVSGGADSFALLHMTQAWASARNVTVYAFTVDHGLRPESVAEAEAVKAWCATQNIPHETLQWLGEKPTSALQDSARKARRQLLCEACEYRNIPVLLLGHQRNDQAETILMRLLRGTGLSGMRAMYPFRLDFDTEVLIVRPVLEYTREELRDYCITHDLPFMDDPSNDNTEYERVRMRHVLSHLPALSSGIDVTLRRLSRADEALDRITDMWMGDHVQNVDEDVWFASDAFAAADDEIRIRVLVRVLDDGVRLQDIETLHDHMIAREFTGKTLGTHWIKPKTLAKTKGFLVTAAPPRQIKT